MDAIQGELDATTARLEELRSERDHVLERIAEIELRTADLTQDRIKLVEEAEIRARFLYRQGPAGFAEAVFEAQDFSELYDTVELASRVSSANNELFTRLSRSQEELEDLEAELEDRKVELASTTSELDEATEDLQAKFASVSDEYDDLKALLARIEAREEAAAEAEEEQPDPTGGGAPPVKAPSTNGKACPVNGPVSFIDSWLFPRAGHLHQGVDMMADYGTPLVAIVSGNLSASYSSTGGNSLFLSGDDGNSYWYLHNQQNLITSGHVSAGQQIATVGDTGNATGIPHLHFEYHPGGGAAVNPYPLVASIC
jgi:peptidoglycan LD-endopeptidase LytH